MSDGGWNWLLTSPTGRQTSEADGGVAGRWSQRGRGRGGPTWQESPGAALGRGQSCSEGREKSRNSRILRPHAAAAAAAAAGATPAAAARRATAETRTLVASSVSYAATAAAAAEEQKQGKREKRWR